MEGEGGVYRFWGGRDWRGLLPGALPVSGTSLKEKAGAAIRKNGKTCCYGPCPKRSLKTHHK